jgi:hypothetical protein
MVQEHQCGQLSDVIWNALVKMERHRRFAHTSTLSIAAIFVTSNISPSARR